MPFSLLIKKLSSFLYYKIKFYFGWLSDILFYRRINLTLEKYKLDLILNLEDIIVDDKFEHACEKYIVHKFDLLGSGWICVNFNGLNENQGNSYNNINWQCDFKSNFSWSNKTWYKFIKYGLTNDVDVKVPWELSRMQHLPQLAIYYASKSISEEKKNIIVFEFQNQINDFIKSNPPRFGVNWACTMDVGIRAANLVMSYEIFTASGYIFSREFENSFLNCLYEHGEHIVNNLEWSNTLTSNHYLGNICGLLFLSSILKCEESDKWFYFSINEIFNEFSKQFYDDGVNFESSTSYHRLSTEMIVYSTALILGFEQFQIDRIKKTKFVNFSNAEFPSDLLIKHDLKYLLSTLSEKLFLSLSFTHLLMKKNYEIPQIGDNDSGRFFKFSMPGEFISTKYAKEKYLNLNKYISNDEVFLDENILDHRSLSIALSSLYNFDVLYQSNIEDQVFKMLTKGNVFKSNCTLDKFLVTKKNLIDISEFLKLPYSKRIVYPIKDKTQSFLTDLKLFHFPNAGYLLFKSPILYFFVNAAENGQNGNGGHAHNDKLSFELTISDESIVLDPGTYIYTPNPDMRNKFRSIYAHNSIITESGEQNNWKPGRFGLFNMDENSKCRVIDIVSNRILIEVTYKNILHRRLIEINSSEIVIQDFCNTDFKNNMGHFEYYSNGYGKLMHTKYLYNVN